MDLDETQTKHNSFLSAPTNRIAIISYNIMNNNNSEKNTTKIDNLIKLHSPVAQA